MKLLKLKCGAALKWAVAPRFVLNVGGQLTHTIPVENLEFYLNCDANYAHRVKRVC